MTREELLHLLAHLRQARVGEIRVPHKPLLLLWLWLWLFGRLATTGSSMATYEQAEEPVSRNRGGARALAQPERAAS